MVHVTNECIGCGNCEHVAPKIFKVEGIPATVLKQPETPEEKANYEEAKNACPVLAIQD